MIKAILLATIFTFLACEEPKAGGGDFSEPQQQKIKIVLPEEKKDYTVHVAVIGLIGTLGAAYLISKRGNKK